MGTAAQTYTLAHFANLAYQNSPEVAGWKIIDRGNDAATGFSAVAWQNDTTKEIVIAYRGTDGLSDLGADGAIVGAPISTWSPQFTQGLEFAKQVRDAYPGATISVTGHSLGGAMAQVTAQMFGWFGAGFDPGGAANLVNSSDFRTLAAEFGKPPTGKGVPVDFVNYLVAGSLVSSLSGSHVGHVESLTGWMRSFLDQLGAIGTLSASVILGLAYNFTHLHNMDRIEALLKEMADIETGGALGWGNLMDLELGIDLSVNADYLSARTWAYRDPLAIDLDGDGVETVGIAGGVLFDHNADGIRTGTGWIKSDDALLVLDRDGNGGIDTGAELFGIDYVKSNGQKALNGFDALADLDGNGDQLFNSSDAQYANVKIWRDLNQDGISQSDELQSLSATGIAGIGLAAQNANQNLGNGNTQTATAAYTRADGTTGTVANLVLVDNPFYRAYPDHLDTTTVASLPDMQGAGRLRDLQEAATLSTTLANQLADLQANYRTHDQFDAALDTLIQNWANTADWSATPVGYQAPTLFSGSGYSGLPIAKTSPGLHLMQAPAILGGGLVPYAIIYQPQGITKEQLWGAYRTPLNVTAPPLPEKYLRAVYLIETLERTNGQTFINYNIETGAVTTATGTAIPPEQAGGGSVQLASRESRRWRDGTRKAGEAANGAWRRVA